MLFLPSLSIFLYLYVSTLFIVIVCKLSLTEILMDFAFQKVLILVCVWFFLLFETKLLTL